MIMIKSINRVDTQKKTKKAIDRHETMSIIKVYKVYRQYT